MSLIVDILVFVPQGDSYYLIADLAIAPVVGAALYANVVETPPWARNMVTLSFVGILICWSAVLAVFQGTPYTYFIVVFLVGAALLIPGSVATAFYAGGLICYIVTAYLVLGSPASHGLTLFLEVIGMTLAAWIVSRVLFQARIKAFTAELRLRNLTSRQQEEIQEATEALQRSNQELQKRVHERELLLREIHHRVKNNLQVLASLLHLATNGRRPQDPAAVLRSTESRIRAMAMLHERLHQEEDVARVDLGGHVRELVAAATERYHGEKPVVQSLDLESLLVPVDTAFHLGLIVNEAVTNALSHGFADVASDAKLEVSCVVRNDALLLSIRDNGIGLEGNTEEGLGITMMRALADQLEGTLTIESTNGTEVSCIVPYRGEHFVAGHSTSK